MSATTFTPQKPFFNPRDKVVFYPFNSRLYHVTKRTPYSLLPYYKRMFVVKGFELYCLMMRESGDN